MLLEELLLCSSSFSLPRAVHLHPCVKAGLHLGDPVALDERALGFSVCFLLSRAPLSPQGWVGAGRECPGFSFAFPHTGLHTPCVWG